MGITGTPSLSNIKVSTRKLDPRREIFEYDRGRMDRFHWYYVMFSLFSSYILLSFFLYGKLSFLVPFILLPYP